MLTTLFRVLILSEVFDFYVLECNNVPVGRLWNDGEDIFADFVVCPALGTYNEFWLYE